MVLKTRSVGIQGCWYIQIIFSNRIFSSENVIVSHYGLYLSALEIKGLYIKRYINSSVYFTLLYMYFTFVHKASAPSSRPLESFFLQIHDAAVQVFLVIKLVQVRLSVCTFDRV